MIETNEVSETREQNVSNNTTPKATEKGLLLLERIFRVSIIMALFATATSTLLFDVFFTLSVFLGSAIAVGNIWLLVWIGRRWANGRREGMLLLLLGKVWLAAIALFLMLRSLPIDVSGIVLGMAASLAALLWGAVFESRALMREATENKDA